MAVNSTTWKKLPMVARETPFNADEAIARITQWAAGSQEKFASAFFWNAGAGAGTNPNNYRLPVGDIYNSKLALVPRAVFTAASILSGAHGGLEDVVGKEERDQLKRVLTQIYDVFREKWNDRRQIPPWLRGGNEMGQTVASLTAAVNSSGWPSMPIADKSVSWNGAAAKTALWEWADGDLRKYRDGFLWWDQTNPDIRGSYKLPIATPVDGTLTIIPAAVNAVAAVLGGARGGVDIPDEDQDRVEAVVNRIQSRFEEDPAVTAAATGVYPDAALFGDPNLQGPTPLVVTPEREVMGHLALWRTCHAGIGDRCVMAPKSSAAYRYFHNGSVLTADGQMLRVGKITMGTGHANKNWGYVPAADHYDNTGTTVAIVAAGEDQWGIWIHGTVVPEATEAQVQQLRRSPLSGDWRRPNGGDLELTAALAVNTPGFPIVSLSASGEIESLCAAGVVLSDGTVAGDAEVPLSGPDKEQLEKLAKLDKQWATINNSLRKAQLRTVLAKGI